MASITVLPDTVADHDSDLLKFSRYVDPLVRVLINPATKTPLTIGVFGAWGSGKSTLLSMLDARLRPLQNDCVRVHFNPWMHRKEPNLLIPLLHTLQDTLLQDAKARFGDSAQRITGVLLRLGADALLKTITGGSVSLEGIEKAEKEFVAAKGRVQSEIRSLRKTLEGIAQDVHDKGGGRIVFFIDDLDRCEPTEIVDLLEGIKLFLDVPHVVVVLAVDKEVVDRGIAIKYEKFFASGNGKRAAGIGAEYLEKMVQLPLTLFPIKQTEVGRCLQQMHLGWLPPDIHTLLTTLVFPNPRKMKRVLNLIAVNSAIGGAGSLASPLAAGRARIAVIQVQNPDLYSDIVQIPELLQALEMVYRGTLKASDQPQLEAKFPGRGAVLKRLCEQHYDQRSYLSTLFAASAFAAAGNDVSDFFGAHGD